MADNPWKPKDDGQIGLPSIDPGMNKLRPSVTRVDPPKRLGLNDNNTKGDVKLLDKIRKRMDRCITAESERRKSQTAAQKFGAGDQWDAQDRDQRNNEQRPCITVDRLGPLIRQVVNNQRLNRPAINVSPVGDKGDPEAAKMFRGLIRAIERECGADIAYDTAFESAVRIGEGYFRFNVEYESETSMNQVIVVERIRNRFTVYGDPDSKQPDGADWRYCFVSEIIPLDEYKEEFPDFEPVNFEQSGTGDKFKAWFTKDGVRIAEYIEVEKKPRSLVRLSNGHVGWKDELHEDVEGDIEAGRLEVIEERESYERAVKWYKTNGIDIISRGEWLGKWIPIVQVCGNELDLEGKLKLTGLIEPAMDAQRLANYWRTMYAECLALTPKAKFIMAEGQDEGYEDEWKTANRSVQPVLHYRPLAFGGNNLPPPNPIPPPGVAQGFEKGAEMADMDMMATTGVRFDVAQDRHNVDPRSGKAIRAFQTPQDLGIAHYMDNFKRSLKHAGDIFIDLIPKIYDEKRQLVILREDDTEQKIEIDPHASKPLGEKQDASGKKLPTFNPTIGKYGVTVTIGPDFATKRQEASEEMLEFMQAIPQVAHFIADLVAKNKDWEGADEIAQRLAKTIPAQLMAPDKKDMTPQTSAYVQNLEGQVKQLGQQLQLAAKEIQEKDKDRAVAQDKIDKDYEAKILKVIADTSKEAAKIAVQEAKLHLEGHKAEHGAHMAERAQDLAEHPPKKEKANAS